MLIYLVVLDDDAIADLFLTTDYWVILVPVSAVIRKEEYNISLD